MTQTEFISKSRTWLNHKIILSRSSNWYKTKGIKTALIYVQSNFASFLNTKGQYSAGQLALLIKRNEALLETILPIPNNPSYQNSLTVLNQLINEAENIINQYNLSV